MKLYNHIESVFNINYDIKLTANDKIILPELDEEVKRYINEYGQEGKVRIKEIIHDSLLEAEEYNLIKYLGLEFTEEITETFNSKLNDENFLKIENKEEDNDFFKSYLIDETLNDLYYSWKGYIKKAEGNKEIFIKVRKAIIPSRQIDSLYSLIINNFNKINFLSEKEDEEQARIIILTMEQSLEILLEIPYYCCDTPKIIEIISAIGIKLTNLIGFSKGNREAILSALSDSYQSKEDKIKKKSPITEND